MDRKNPAQTLPFYQTGYHDKHTATWWSKTEKHISGLPIHMIYMHNHASSCVQKNTKHSDTATHTHIPHFHRDQHQSHPALASKSATEHASCSRRPLHTKRSAGWIDRSMHKVAGAGTPPVSMRHSTTLIRERRRRSTATGSCSRMGPCAVRLCLWPGGSV